MPLYSKIFGLEVSGILFCAEASPPFDTRSYSRTCRPRLFRHKLVLLNIRCTFSQLGYGNGCTLAVLDSFLHLNRTLVDVQYENRIARCSLGSGDSMRPPWPSGGVKRGLIDGIQWLAIAVLGSFCTRAFCTQSACQPKQKVWNNCGMLHGKRRKRKSDNELVAKEQ